jgi:tetratricopeptide (TPR) repeat protein
MASLTGQKIKDTYQSLLKTDDNGLITSAFKGVTDGSGSASGLYLKNDGTLLSGSIVISGSLLYSGSTINATVTSASHAAYAITASYALNGGGGGGSINTSSLATTGSNIFIGNQIIAGNVTFPSGSFISTTDESGSLSFSALNGGTLYLNSDGGEGDVLVGYDGWDSKLKVRGEVEITGSIYLGSGSIISESGSNLVLTPPTALPGQGLVIRPTSGNMILSASGFIVAGETLTITLTSSQFSAASQEDFYYLISGSTAQELGLPSLTGSFLQANWIDAGGNTGYNETAIPIPGNSNATTLTLTITGSSMFFGGYSFTNNPITVTNNGIINNELSHIHLVTSDPAITDLYLGDDDQYVKIEKNAGDVVIGTNNNTHHWTFDTSGSLTVPGDITGAGNLATTGSNEFNGNQGITGSLEQGSGVVASGSYSHAEGNITQAIGDYSHAEGDNTQAIGNYSHAEGQEAISVGSYSHAEGYDTRAIGNYSHAEGAGTKTGTQNAYYAESVVNGVITLSGSYDDVSGQFGVDNRLYLYDVPFDDNYGKEIFIVSQSYFDSNNTIVELYDTSVNTTTAYVGDLGQGINNWTGDQTIPGNYAHAEGSNTRAIGEHSHAEGASAQAIGNYSHAEGEAVQAIGGASHAEGYQTKAIGQYSHAEGDSTQAIGDYSHAEGESTQAIGIRSHAEGLNTIASGSNSHAEGISAEAIGDFAHAEGYFTQALEYASHAEGRRTIASGSYQHVSGQYNQHNNDTSYFVVGIGLTEETRKDGFTVDVDANGSGSVMIPWNLNHPSNPKTGSMYFNPTSTRLYFYTGNGGDNGWNYFAVQA